MLYGVHISSIEFDSTWGRHLVLLSRLTFDFILIQGVLRLLAIRATINEAVAAVKADPEMAVRLGRRAIPALIAKLQDPDKMVRGAAANALMQLGDRRAIQPLIQAIQE
jgi:HEAT repeat protein